MQEVFDNLINELSHEFSTLLQEEVDEEQISNDLILLIEKNKKVVELLLKVKTGSEWGYLFSLEKFIKTIPSSVKKNKEFINSLINLHGASFLEYADDELKTDLRYLENLEKIDSEIINYSYLLCTINKKVIQFVRENHRIPKVIIERNIPIDLELAIEFASHTTGYEFIPVKFWSHEKIWPIINEEYFDIDIDYSEYPEILDEINDFNIEVWDNESILLKLSPKVLSQFVDKISFRLKDNEDFIINSKCKGLFSAASLRLKKKKDFVIKGLEYLKWDNKDFLSEFSNDLKSMIFFDATMPGNFLDKVSPGLKKNKLLQDYKLRRYPDRPSKEDVIGQDTRYYKNLSSSLLHDFDIAKEACLSYHENIYFVPQSLINDRFFFISIISFATVTMHSYDKFIPIKFWDDFEIIQKLFYSKNSSKDYFFISSRIRNNRNLFLQFVMFIQQPIMLKAYKDDEEIAFQILIKNPSQFSSISKSLQNNEEFISRVLKVNQKILFYAPKEFAQSTSLLNIATSEHPDILSIRSLGKFFDKKIYKSSNYIFDLIIDNINFIELLEYDQIFNSGLGIESIEDIPNSDYQDYQDYQDYSLSNKGEIQESAKLNNLSIKNNTVEEIKTSVRKMFWTSPNECLQKIALNPIYYSIAPPNWKCDPDFISKVIKVCIPPKFDYLPIFEMNKKLTLELLNKNLIGIDKLDEHIFHDSEIFGALLLNCPHPYLYANFSNHEAYKNKELMKKVFNKRTEILYETSVFKDDPEILLEAIAKDFRYFSCVSENLKKNKKFMIRAIGANPRCISMRSPLKKDFDLLTKVIEKDYTALEINFGLTKIKREEMLKLLKLNGNIIRYLPIKDHLDKEIVKTAISSNPQSLEFIDPLILSLFHLNN